MPYCCVQVTGENEDHWQISTSACVVPNRPLERIVQSFRILQEQVARQKIQIESSQQQLENERRKSHLELQLLQNGPAIASCSSQVADDSPNLCEVHSDEVMDKNLYCIPCAMLICHLCHSDSSHKGHNVVSARLHHDFIKHQVCLRNKSGFYCSLLAIFAVKCS